MTSIPAAITTEQGRSVLRALGLPPSLVAEVRLTVGEAATVTLLLRDREGRHVLRDEQPLTMTVRIPYTDAT
ncbi:hypothetical protein [Streptomyces sp. NPDC026673]|uniref:hypothetical protein n=1 Tax=Streptomyces sp. NPDC026673 TaxID=3155724 RepID=UPI0033D7B9BF